jgi:hypothetical protein
MPIKLQSLIANSSLINLLFSFFLLSSTHQFRLGSGFYITLIIISIVNKLEYFFSKSSHFSLNCYFTILLNYSIIRILQISCFVLFFFRKFSCSSSYFFDGKSPRFRFLNISNSLPYMAL